MRARIPAFVVATAVVASIFGPVAAAKPFDGGSGSTPCDGGTVSFAPAKLWPPNHKMRDVTAQFDTPDNDGDTLGLSVDSITHDQIGMNGAGNHEPDWTGEGTSDTGIDTAPPAAPDPATVVFQLRSERSGRDKDGRQYTVTVTCTDFNNIEGGAPETETVTFTVTVPHNRRKA